MQYILVYNQKRNDLVRGDKDVGHPVDGSGHIVNSDIAENSRRYILFDVCNKLALLVQLL